MTSLLPCPFCGCEDVFTYISCCTAVCECGKCGAKPKNAAVTVLYEKGKCPPELDGVETYEATALILLKDGKQIPYPEHNHVGVNVDLAFEAYGVTARWNRRPA